MHIYLLSDKRLIKQLWSTRGKSNICVNTIEHVLSFCMMLLLILMYPIEIVDT